MDDGQDSRRIGLRFPATASDFFSSQLAARFWCWGVKLTTLFHQVPRLRMLELYYYFPIRLHGVVLNPLEPNGYYIFRML
jgi:hypothetical protein